VCESVRMRVSLVQIPFCFWEKTKRRKKERERNQSGEESDTRSLRSPNNHKSLSSKVDRDEEITESEKQSAHQILS